VRGSGERPEGKRSPKMIHVPQPLVLRAVEKRPLVRASSSILAPVDGGRGCDMDWGSQAPGSIRLRRPADPGIVSEDKSGTRKFPEAAW